jgi:uncharacterized protein YqhQ
MKRGDDPSSEKHGTKSQQFVLTTLLVLGIFIGMFAVISLNSFLEDFQNGISTTEIVPATEGIIISIAIFALFIFLYKKWRLNWKWKEALDDI